MTIEVGGQPSTGNVIILATVEGVHQPVLSLKPDEAIPVIQGLIATVAQHPDLELRQELYRQIQPSGWQILGSSGSGVHVSYKAAFLDGALDMPAELIRALAAALDEPPMHPQ